MFINYFEFVVHTYADTKKIPNHQKRQLMPKQKMSFFIASLKSININTTLYIPID